MDKLDFSLPPLRAQSSNDPLPAAEAIPAWVDALPMAHTGELGRHIFATLNALREVELSEDYRSQLLLALRPALTVVQENLRLRFQRQALPLPQKSMKVFHLSTALFLAEAQGWLRVLEAPLQKGWLFSNRKRGLDARAQAAQRAMRALGEILDNYRHLHLSDPRGLWRMLHNTLRAADALGVATRRPEVIGEESPSPLNEYSRQILLSQLPYQQISNRHMRLLEANINEWAAHVQLEPGEGFNDRGGLYLYLDSDLPPIPPGSYYQRIDERQARADRHFLNLNELLERLEHGEPELDPELRECLLEKWRANQGRDERRGEEGDYTLHYGMSAIYRFLKAQADAAEPREENEEEEEENTLPDVDFGIEGLVPDMHEERLENADVWDKVYITSESSHWSDKFAPGEALPPQQGELRNRSRGGICVSLDSGRHSCFRCGELVAVEDGNGMRLGALRWVRGGAETQVEFGIQWLADAPQPVFLHIGAADGPLQPAMLAHDGSYGLLLVPRLPGLENRPLWLEYDGELRRVDTSETHTGSNYFLAYRCQVADESIERVSKASSDEFDTLWQEL